MKKTMTALAAMFLVSAAMAVEVNGEVEVTSLYKSRGVDQSSKGTHTYPALQAGVTASQNGFYAGAWASTGKFENARSELDLYVGKRGTLGAVGYDVGFYRYIYGNQSSWNSGEAFLGLTAGNFSLYNYRGVTSDVNKGDWYHALSYTHTINKDLTLVGGLGYTNRKHGDDKSDYSVALNYKLDAQTTVYVKSQGAFNAETEHQKNRVIVGFKVNF